MVPEGHLWGARGPTLQGQGATAAQGSPGKAKRCLKGCLFPRGCAWGRLWYVQPVKLETLGEGISDLRDLSWERCFKPLYLLLLMCA